MLMHDKGSRNKSPFFSGPTTKAFTPPPGLSGHMELFFPRPQIKKMFKKVPFSLVVGP